MNHKTTAPNWLRSLALAGLSGLSLAGTAHAEGLYIGGSVGSSHYKGSSIGGVATDRSSTGSKLFGGYQITPNLAVEGGYVDFGKFTSAAGQLKADGLYLDAVGSVPLSGPLTAYGKLGVFNGKTKGSLVGSDRGTSAKLGAGLNYAIDRKHSVQGEWERYRLDTSGVRANTDLYTLGVKYSF